MKNIGLWCVVICYVLMGAGDATAQKAGRQYYSITVYHYSHAEQESVLNTYLEKALIPALNRMKIAPVGVFRSIANDTATDKTMWVLMPLKQLAEAQSIRAKLNADKAYLSAGDTYLNATNSAAPYTRMETILLQAFAMAPTMQVPALTAAPENRVYELRSYESPTEKIFANKVHMFNEGGEVGLFKKLNFNAVFYGEVLAGSKMPNLMYMTSFNSMADRDAHWKAFSADPDWKQLSAMPMYQKNVSHMDIFFLRPTSYSQL